MNWIQEFLLLLVKIFFFAASFCLKLSTTDFYLQIQIHRKKRKKKLRYNNCLKFDKIIC